MKLKSLLFAAALLSFVAVVNAQKIYLNVGTGYGLNAYGFNIGESKASGTSITHSTKNLNFGTGLNFTLRGGYMINKNLAVELGVGYRMHKSEFNSEYAYTSGTSQTKSTGFEEFKFRMLQVPVSVRLSAGEGKMKWYSRFGLNLGFGAKMTDHYSSNITYTDLSGPFSSTTSNVSEMEYTKGLSLGVAGAFGFVYQFTDKLGISFEVNANAQGYAPKKGILVKSTTDGVDDLPGMTTSQKETDFVKSYTEDNSTAPNPATPSKELKFAYPLSTWGFGIGLHMNIGAAQ